MLRSSCGGFDHVLPKDLILLTPTRYQYTIQTTYYSTGMPMVPLQCQQSYEIRMHSVIRPWQHILHFQLELIAPSTCWTAGASHSTSLRNKKEHGGTPDEYHCNKEHIYAAIQRHMKGNPHRWNPSSSCASDKGPVHPNFFLQKSWMSSSL